MFAASSATKDWASDTDKAGASAETAAKKSTGAFSRISTAIKGTRSEAKKGADFKLRADEGGLSKIASRIKGVRGDANKGADFEVRANDNAFSKITSRIKAVRSNVNKGADFAVRGDERGFSGIMKRIGAARSDANKGAEFDLKANESGLSKIGSAIRSLRGDANKGANFNLKASDSGLSGIKGAISSARTEAGKGATFKVDTGSSESSLSGLKDSMKDVAAVAGGIVIGDAAGGGIEGLSTSFQDAARSAGMLQAQLGVSKTEAEAFKGVGIDVYTSNWGDSLAETTNAVGLVQQGLSGLGSSKSELQGLTESTFILRDAFGIDLPESVDAVRQMTQNFGISGERSMDLIAAGAQRGANVSGDLADSLTEYSPYFAELGLSAEQAMGTFVAGTQNGIRNTDLLADSVKEFSIRAVDGSDSTAKGFKAAGLDADKMGAAIAKGGPAAEEAFGKTLAGLESIKDPRKREMAGVALFGTQYEDLGPKMLTSLQQGTKGMKDVEGSTKRAGDAMSDNLGSKISGVTRKLNTMVSGQFGAGIGEIAAGAGEAGIAVGGIAIGASTAAPLVGKVSGGLRGLAASNVVVGTTATGASVGMTRMAVAGRVLRGVMLTMVLPVAAVVGLGAAFFYAYNKSERFRAGVDKLDTALIGSKNTAEITKNGWKGLGNVASDNSGISILWAKDLGKVEAGMRRNSEAATPFNRAMLDLGQRMRDNKGLSGGLSGVWRSMKTTMTDNKGLSDLWSKGTGNLTSKLTDNKGASGALRGAWAGLKQRAMDNKGASAAWAGGLEGLRKRISDNKGISSAWSGGLAGLRKKLTDSKGASGALGGALSGLKNRLTDSKGASGALKTALGSLKEKAVGAGAGFVTLRNQGLAKLGELKNKGITLAGNLGTSAVKRFEEMRSGSRGKFQQQTANGIAKLAELGKRGGENIGSFVKGGLDKYTEMRKGGAGRFEALRGAVVDRLSEAKTRGIQRTHEMGTELMASWGRQSKKAGERYSQVRDYIGDKLREGKTRGIARIHELGTEAYASWGRQSDKASERYSSIRDTIGDKLREGKTRGIERTHELGTELKASWGRQWEAAKDKFSGIRGTIGSNLSDAKDRGIEHMRTLGGGLRDAYGRFLTFTGGFGDRFKTILGDKFGGAINKAREWLGGLMKAVANVLGAFGADGLSGDARSLGNGLQEPLKFARGGITNPKDGYGIVGEAGQREAVVNLEQRTPESVAALRAANASPNASGRTHRGGGDTPLKLPRNLNTPNGPQAMSAGAPHPASGSINWDNVDNSGKMRVYTDATKYKSEFTNAISNWNAVGGVDISSGHLNTDVRVYDQSLDGANGMAYPDGRIYMDPNISSYPERTATHELGHHLRHGHVYGNSIMGDAPRSVVAPTSYDRGVQTNIWGGSGGSSGGKKDPSGSHEESNLKNYSSNFDSGTQPHVARVANYMNDKFPAIDVIGGYRPGDPQDHGKGLALDLMTGPLGSSGANNGLMDSIATHMKANWDAMALTYLISRQRIDTGSGWAGMENRGNNTENHMDHVHASFSPNAGSGIVSGAGGGGGGGLFDWMGAITSGLAKVGTPDIGLGMVGGGMKSYAGTLLGKAKDFLVDKAKGLFGGLFGGGGGSGAYKGGGNLDEWAKNGLILGNVFEPNASNISKIKSRAMQESGGDPNAQNNWDINALNGTPSKGLMQIIEGTWEANTTPEIGGFDANWNNPVKSVGVACVPTDSTRILTRRGWLRYDEVEVGDETLGYNFEGGKNEWTGITAVLHYEDAPVVRAGTSRWSIEQTSNHRWLIERPYGRAEVRADALVPLEDLKRKDVLKLSAYAETGDGLDITLEEAALVAWIQGDGCIDKPKGAGRPSIRIVQCKPAMVEKLRALLYRSGYTYSESVSAALHGKHHMHTFCLGVVATGRLLIRAGGAFENPEDFVLSLSPEQRAAWFEAIVDAEGSLKLAARQKVPTVSVAQNAGPMQDAIRLAIYLEGYRPSVNHYREKTMANVLAVGPRVYVQPKNFHVEDSRETDVWCVTTELGTWTACQGDHVFLTGNSRYMKSKYGTVVGATGVGYGAGGVIPGAPGKEVITKAHAGERILSERNNVAFERLANSVKLWSSRQQGAKAVEIRETGDSSGEMPREELRAIRNELAAMRRTLAQEIGNEVGGRLMGKPGERNQLRHTKNVNERHKAAGLVS